MNKNALEIIIPIYNEGSKVLELMELFKKKIKINFKILFCYDDASDNIFDYEDELKKFDFDIEFIKNPSQGPCSAIKEGFSVGVSDCVIVYPCDDFINVELINKMHHLFLTGKDIVAASRFMKGGSMKGCPLIKSILVRSASFTLYHLSSIPIKDASNGFRLFSRKLLNEVNVESKVGFAYSLELLVKCNRLNYAISEIPAQWEERSEGSSRFKVFKWLPQYLRWYIYGLSTTWLRKKKI